MNTLTLSTSAAAALAPQTFPEKKKLNSQILGRLAFCLTSLKNELNLLPEKHWSIARDEYEIGSWKSCVLAERKTKKEGLRLTVAGKRMKSVVSSLQAQIDWSRVRSVRLLSSGANGLMIPHSWGSSKGLRLQIPLFTDEMCLNSEDALVFHMRQFEVWWMDGSCVHAAGSFGFIGRLHLEIECDEGSSPVKAGAFHDLLPHFVKKPQLTRAKEKIFLDAAREKVKEDFLQALKILSQVHFYYKSESSQIYEWLEQLAQEAGKPSLMKTVSLLKRRHLN